MKFLLITEEFPPFKGGIANYYGNLVNFWPLGESLAVLNNNRGELRRSGRHLSWWPAFSALKRKIKLGKIDYVLVGQILPYGTVAYISSFFNKKPYAVFLHGLDLSLALSGPRKKILARLILSRATKIICANSHVARIVQDNFSFHGATKDKVAVVNPGVVSGAPYVSSETLIDLRKVHGLEGKTVLLTVGRLVKRKGVDQVIKLLEAMPDDQAEKFVYFVAGTGPAETELKSMVSNKQRGNIRFLGEISDKEKWEMYRLCDIFVMPARDIDGDYEGFGIAYLEANICGKPVIAGRSGGVSDAVEDGVNGIMVDPEDLEQISQAIIRLAGDEKLRDFLGEEGRKRAIKKFSWEALALRLSKSLRLN